MSLSAILNQIEALTGPTADDARAILSGWEDTKARVKIYKHVVSRAENELSTIKKISLLNEKINQIENNRPSECLQIAEELKAISADATFSDASEAVKKEFDDAVSSCFEYAFDEWKYWVENLIPSSQRSPQTDFSSILDNIAKALKHKLVLRKQRTKMLEHEDARVSLDRAMHFPRSVLSLMSSIDAMSQTDSVSSSSLSLVSLFDMSNNILRRNLDGFFDLHSKVFQSGVENPVKKFGDIMSKLLQRITSYWGLLIYIYGDFDGVEPPVSATIFEFLQFYIEKAVSNGVLDESQLLSYSKFLNENTNNIIIKIFSRLNKVSPNITIENAVEILKSLGQTIGSPVGPFFMELILNGQTASVDDFLTTYSCISRIVSLMEPVLIRDGDLSSHLSPLLWNTCNEEEIRAQCRIIGLIGASDNQAIEKSPAVSHVLRIYTNAVFFVPAANKFDSTVRATIRQLKSHSQSQQNENLMQRVSSIPNIFDETWFASLPDALKEALSENFDAILSTSITAPSKEQQPQGTKPKSRANMI